MDFEVLVRELSPSDIEISVVEPHWATATTQSVLPFDDSELASILDQLADSASTAAPVMQAQIAEWGGRLFDSLFAGGVRDEFMRCWGRAEVSAQKETMRIILRLEGEGLHRQPWEMLYHTVIERHLACEPPYTFMRSLRAVVAEVPRVELPLRVAFLVSAPDNQSDLGFSRFAWEELEKEAAQIRSALQPLEGRAVECDTRSFRAFAELQADARQARPINVLHVVGHGCFRDRVGQLLLEDDSHQGFLLSGQDFSRQLKRDRLRLVFLNCCDSGRLGGGSMAGLAQALVYYGIPAVIGMQFPVNDPFAQRFAVEFYRELTREGRVWIDRCVREARRNSMLLPGQSRVMTAEWCAPALFSLLRSEPLFEVQSPGWPALEPPPTAPRRTGQSFRQATFAGQNLIGRDFSNADLSGADFRSANLTQVKFVQAVLVGADLRGTILQGTDFRGANCRGVRVDPAALKRGTQTWKEAIWDEPLRQELARD
jgi:hypothetical protein